MTTSAKAANCLVEYVGLHSYRQRTTLDPIS